MSSAAPLAADAPPPTARRTTDTLADGVVILLGMMIVQRVFGFGRNILFCRWLEPEAFGQWAMAFDFMMMAAPAAILSLPGAFGRYVEYYRQRGQLRTFLRRTTAWTAILGVCSLVAIWFCRAWVADQIFGSPTFGGMVTLCLAVLAIVIVHHYLEALFTALRMTRVVSGMQFVQSVGFAVAGTALLWCWQMGPQSIIIAYGLASVVSAVGSCFWLRMALADVVHSTDTVTQRVFWAKLLPFAGWMWISNLLANMFAYVDKYMILHYSGLQPDEALAQIGYYHSSLIIPALLINAVLLLGSMLTPHLSHDWESGRRDSAVRQLNLALKLISLGSMSVAVLVLASGSVLFSVILGGKYDAGLVVLPLTLNYCLWFGIAMVAHNGLLCAERPRLGSITVVVGLLVNVGLNLILLPRYGLWGAILSTTVANCATLAITFVFNGLVGVPMHRGVWIVSLAPAALAFGMWPALAVLVVLVVLAIATDKLFDSTEKLQLAAVAAGYLDKFNSLRGHVPAAGHRR